MSFERITSPERVTPPDELFSPAVTHLRRVSSMIPVAVLVTMQLVAPTATPTGTARSVWQPSLPLLILAIAVTLAADLIRIRLTHLRKESAVMPVVELRNLTPHPVTLLPVSGGPAVSISPSGPVPRVELIREDVGPIATSHGAIRITETQLGPAVDGLPDPLSSVLLIVSRITAEALPLRTDLVFPDDLVRDGSGAVVGARALGRVRTLAGHTAG